MTSMRLFLLLSFIASLMLLEAYGFTDDETDRQALLEFKSQVSQDKRVFLSSWNHSFPLCNWYGVTCGRKHKRVVGLELGGLQLGGVISPAIGNLSFLRSLNLSDNSFGGTIPPEVGNLFRLEHLSMRSNVLEGEIPSSLSNCSRLLTLSLASNNLGESIPSELGSLTNLVGVYLSKNNLKGKLPQSLGNLTSVKELDVVYNHIEGEVPESVGRLGQIVGLGLGMNEFSGSFPPCIYNLSLLEELVILGNEFAGSLRHDFGNLLPNLGGLSMANNYFTGAIPTTLANISTLEKLGINDNNLTGSIPSNFGKVRNLQFLSLGANSLGSYSFGDLDFLASLTNCTKLEHLMFYQNRLGGVLPTSIANLSKTLVRLEIAENLISGTIPHDIGNLIGLQTLGWHKNLLTGPLPKLLGLSVLSLHSNRLSGEIPSSLGNFTQLGKLYLFNNSFQGTIPPSLGNCSYMVHLSIGHNKLNGTIPQEIMGIQPLIYLGVSNNSLTGSLPKDIGRLENLARLDVAHNKFSGQLPESLGKCLSMEELYMRGNSFEGTIPDISGLMGVREVDLSRNHLSGSIPGYFANFSKLKYLNLSFNNLEGRVPTEGKFQNASIFLVFGNKHLCGGIRELQLKPCSAQEPPPMGKNHGSLLKKVAIGVSIGIALLLLFCIASVLSLIWFRKRNKNQQTTNNPTLSTLGAFHEKISYGYLRNATDGFSSSNLIGLGSFGAVFKALLPPEGNNIVAVKVLNMRRRGAMKSFMAECESLKDIRHRNLVKLLTACSSIDFQGNQFRALIYEFMPNGSLDMWLHSEEVEEIRRPSRNLTLLERLNIAIDVASVLEYLHVHCHEPIAHCDLKPSNVLLDDDLTARVSDFGLARLLLKFDQESFLDQLSSAGVRGTIGYVAPEYGIGGHPSIQGDVYSFGVLILEMFTGKRPTDELFGGNFTLRSYIKSVLQERVLDVADKSIHHVGFPIAECLKLVFEVGLSWCEESPMNRLATSEALKELVSIKESFFRAKRTAKR